MIDLDKAGFGLPNGQRGKKYRQREYGDENQEEITSNKQSAVYGDDFEPTEMLDKVLLYDGDNERESAQKGKIEKLQLK